MLLTAKSTAWRLIFEVTFAILAPVLVAFAAVVAPFMSLVATFPTAPKATPEIAPTKAALPTPAHVIFCPVSAAPIIYAAVSNNAPPIAAPINHASSPVSSVILTGLFRQ